MTPQPLPNTTPDTAHFTNVMWAELVLTFLGAPVTQNNVDNFTSWMQAENSASTWTGTAGANNPLNNGLGSGGGSGLGSFPDLIVSAAFAAKGLEGGITGGQYIGNALKANAPFSVFHAATLQATWSGDHYSGTGWASQSAPSPAPSITAAQSQSNGASKGVAVASANTQFIVNNMGLLAGKSLAGALGALPTNLGNAAGDVANAATGGAAGGLSTLLGDLTSASWWLRVGMGALGVFLFLVGLAGFISTTQPGQAAKSDAGAAVKDAATVAVAA
jgi:hypothetical protein